MFKIIAIAALIFVASRADAQDKHSLDSVDQVIIDKIITPAEQAGGDAEPNWSSIKQQTLAGYSAVQTDRAVTKAQIYFYWTKDWPKFSTAIVHYTEAYEDKDDLDLMNKNAKFILQWSADPKEWATALRWIQHGVDKAPDNADYKATRDGLVAKINGK
jgi:hypothetical protein